MKKMAQFNIVNADARTTRKQARIESRILEIASKIANDKYAAKMYSNFHTWEAFRNISTKASACGEAAHRQRRPQHSGEKVFHEQKQ